MTYLILFLTCLVLATIASMQGETASLQSRPVGQTHLDIDNSVKESHFQATQKFQAFRFANISAGLANSFEQDTLVHTRVLTDTGYQTKLKPIKDIQNDDEVLPWDELQAHDNAVLAPSGQAVQTLQAAYQQANFNEKSAPSPINISASSYENKSVLNPFA